MERPPAMQDLIDYLHDEVCGGDELMYGVLLQALVRGYDHPDEQRGARKAVKLLTRKYQPSKAELEVCGARGILDRVIDTMVAAGRARVSRDGGAEEIVAEK